MMVSVSRATVIKVCYSREEKNKSLKHIICNDYRNFGHFHPSKAYDRTICILKGCTWSVNPPGIKFCEGLFNSPFPSRYTPFQNLFLNNSFLYSFWLFHKSFFNSTCI